MTAPVEDAAGFVPPSYPYDRLTALVERAAAHPGGAVDLSIGTPCDPPPPAAVAALAASGTERGYPSAVGGEGLRRAAVDWMGRRLGVQVDAAHVAACVGTKEFVATAAWWLRLREPGRDTVLHPAVAYPTYAMGARLAGCRAVGVPEAPDGGLDLAAVDPDDAGRALALWVNSPANPTGALTDLAAAAAWGRARDVPVLSDECYVEFSWAAPPATILQAGSEGVLAVHSLSKRSNFAGVRAGFYAGDPDLVAYLAEVRKHAGLMTPGPVQAAATVALMDDEHVDEQRAVYRRRLWRLAEALSAAGLEVDLPAGAFYLWAPAPAWAHDAAAVSGTAPGWALAATLAETAGMVVAPGDLYGEAEAEHVRIALVQPDDRLDLVIERLASAPLSSGAR